MPPHTPHDRSQSHRAPHSDGASFTATRTLPQGRPSSYSSLEQALVPPAHTRDDRRRSSQPRDALRSPSAMSSDGRYLYHSPQEVAPQYAYPPYASYDAAQYPPSSSRPARNGAPPPHPSPPQQPQPAPYSAPPQGYPQPGYPPPSYGVPPQPNAAPWTAPEGPWPPYTAPAFVPPASAVPQGTPQGFGRPDAQPQQPASETSSASPGGPAHPDNRRVEERAERAGGDSAPPTKGRKNNRTDSENPGPTPLSPASAALDYNKVSTLVLLCRGQAAHG